MEKIKEIKPFTPPDGGYGWIIILAVTVINICVLPLTQNFGIIFQNEFVIMQISAAETSFLLHLHNAIYCCLGLFSTPLLKKFSYRQVALIGTCLMCTGIFLTSFAQSYALLICTFSVLIGVGQGTLLPATYVATNSYFKKRLTLAISFSVTGAGFSSVFMPQLCNWFLTDYGRQNSVLILSGISAIAIFFCFLLKPIEQNTTNKTVNNVAVLKEDDAEILENLNKPDEVVIDELRSPHQELDVVASTANPGLTTDAVYKSTTTSVLIINNNNRTPPRRIGIFKKLYNLFNLELLKDRAYVVVIVGMAISFASELNVILMIAFVLPELANFSQTDVAMFLTMQSFADILGRFIIPLVAHNFNLSPKVMYVSSLVTSTIGRTVLAVFYQSRTTVCVCAWIFGFAKGSKAVYQSVIIPKYVTLDKLAAGNGLNMMLTGVVSLIVGPIIGAVHDLTNSYIYALHIASLISMSCVVLWIIDYFIGTRTKPPENE